MRERQTDRERETEGREGRSLCVSVSVCLCTCMSACLCACVSASAYGRDWRNSKDSAASPPFVPSFLLPSRAVRGRIHDCFEAASFPSLSPQQVKDLLTFVVVRSSVLIQIDELSFLTHDAMSHQPGVRVCVCACVCACLSLDLSRPLSTSTSTSFCASLKPGWRGSNGR